MATAFNAPSSLKTSSELKELKQDALGLPQAARAGLFQSLWPHLRLYGLEFRLNDGEPLVWNSRLSLSSALYILGDGATKLTIQSEAKDGVKVRSLSNVKVGDRLRFRYLRLDESEVHPNVSSVGAGLPSSAQAPRRSGIGFDVQMETGAPVRVWHPGNSGVVFRLNNDCVSHASVSAVAQMEQESWLWQFPALNPGQTVSIKILETGWYDAPSCKESHRDA